MNNFNLPLNNKFLPKDTRNALLMNNRSDNFYYYFGLPLIIERDNLPDKIHINENIRRFRWDQNFIQSIHRRHEKAIKSLSLPYSILKAKLSWRMVVGLGASHPQETSMTLNHIYGIPYIPGSAVKGVTRHWIIQRDFSGNEELAEKDENFKNIFGTQKQTGKIIFFDAYPEESPNLKIDIMNPHYPEYYEGKAPPADWQNPVPIKFLTVENTKFIFCLASQRGNESLLSQASQWLRDALANHGIGAKTSLGYGIFENF